MHSHIIKMLSISILALTPFVTQAAIKNSNSGLTFWNYSDKTPVATYVNGSERKEHKIPPLGSMGIRLSLPLDENALIRFSVEDDSCTLNDFGKRANRLKDCERAFFQFSTDGNFCEFQTVGINCPNPALNQPQIIQVPITKTANK